jgi:hypothetical protein
MKILVFTNWQFGIMLSFGTNYEKRKYLTIELPFLVIQILFKPPKNSKGEIIENGRNGY